MIKENSKILLEQLLQDYLSAKSFTIKKLPQSGSKREYFRISYNGGTLIAAFNDDQKENDAFVYFTKFFNSAGLPVPELKHYDKENNFYLISYLGDETLYERLVKQRTEDEFPSELVALYKAAIKKLIDFQLIDRKTIDISKCYPRSHFDRRSMLWDLNYFKYYFLKLADISFNEDALQNDFEIFIDFLSKTESNFFMYRDFQSRNIMVKENQLYFIDYQGGRLGPLQYDLASLLFDAKADLPFELREELLNYYTELISKRITIDKKKFINEYYGFVLIRILQAMGAYGYRGFFERKPHFLKSIPYAQKNLEWLLNNNKINLKADELQQVLKNIIDSPELKRYNNKNSIENNLTVRVSSFSYFNEFPKDESGNGGGFTFDCRFIHNPGRYEEYKTLTGKDTPVQEFLCKDKDVDAFLLNTFLIVDKAVENYITKKYTSLMVNFGCTGGQHRSVYCAEQLYKHLSDKYNIKVVLKHIELEKRKDFNK